MTNNKVKNLTVLGLFTAIVIVLQLLGSFIHFGQFSISLTLVPIVIGAALVGPAAGAWLGFVFSVVVLLTDSAAFMAINPVGTILVVLLKGTLAGYLAGVVYKALEKKNRYVAVALSALTAPVVNSGIFALGCFVFFYSTLETWAAGFGFANAASYIFLGLIGANFIFEVILNIVVSPIIVRLIDLREKNHPED